VTRRRSVRLGVVVVALYVVAVMLTNAMRTEGARPLYDGFAPPPSYRFVDPPPFFAAGNVQPGPVSTTIALGPQGSEPAGVATPDGQFVVSLARGAIAPAPGASSVAVTIAPLGPRDLGPLPGGLRADGNAYRVDMTYQPAGGAITRFAKPGTLLVEIPELGNGLFASGDARRWTSIDARTIPPRRLSMSATFAVPGYYLAGTTLPMLTVAGTASGSDSIALGLIVAAAALVVFGAGFVLVRRRRRASAPS
jgi:hypothetical protein